MSTPNSSLAVVTDIEGTTTALSFVKDGLFPIARRHLPGFVARHRDDPEVRRILAETARESGKDPQDEDALVAQLLAWIDEDRKIAPLKSLQGLIWAEGYDSGELKGHIYPDAAQGLRRWHDAGIGIYIYSSGSVTAQKLIFGHSDHGDLTPLLSGYFDTRTGPKLESRSYGLIAKAIGLPASRLLFLSDHPGELDAARAAGWRTAWLNRDNQPSPTDFLHPVFSDFTAIDPAALAGSPPPAG
jgi:enolase-phosphatase E1